MQASLLGAMFSACLRNLAKLHKLLLLMLEDQGMSNIHINNNNQAFALNFLIELTYCAES